MSWLSELAGKAENLLNNLDEQTGAALRNHNGVKSNKMDKSKSKVNSDHFSRRPTTRNRKPALITEARSLLAPNKKLSPPSLPRAQVDVKDKFMLTRKQSPPRKSIPHHISLFSGLETLVNDEDFREEPKETLGLRQRRHSVPADPEVIKHDSMKYRMQKLEVENAMLKNEINVMNSEIADLLDRLRAYEEELLKTHTQLQDSQEENRQIKFENNESVSKIQGLHNQLQNLIDGELSTLKQQNKNLEFELGESKEHNRNLEERINKLIDNVKKKDAMVTKLEMELRHAQTSVTEVQSDFKRSTEECQRLEKEWEAYKLRVKNMLTAKDDEIQALQKGDRLNDETKCLLEQITNLKTERDNLSDCMKKLREECATMQRFQSEHEQRYNECERSVNALRDTLRTERAARCRFEAQYSAVTKELKSLQIETGQTIARLHNALRDKDQELMRIKESASCLRTASSALNVADYDTNKDVEDKIQRLTQTVVQKQGRIDSLLADNNTLRIQLDKLESKYKSEIALHKNPPSSIVNLSDVDHRSRSRTKHAADVLSIRMGVFIKRYPIFRLFILVYMVGLHIWVSTVLLSSTPQENQTPLPVNIR